jgi:Amt family ammonium transporter
MGIFFNAPCAVAATNILFVFIIMYVFFKALNMITPLRVPRDQEIEGLDQHEVAVTAYPDFGIRKTH